MKVPARAIILVLAVHIFASCNDSGGRSRGYPRDTEFRLNHIQVLGSHNSYHPFPAPPPIDVIVNERFGGLRDIVNYRHPPLEGQLDLGVRQVELDVWSDPGGGAFASRPLLAEYGFGPEVDVAELREPGLKVLHIAQIDAESTCWTFASCLRQLKRWSDAHPNHVPIVVMVEIKDVDFFDTATYIPLRPWEAPDYDALDAEIRAVLPADRLITPDDVQGNYPTLREAVRSGGWPTLAQSRGKFLFSSCNCLSGDRQRLDYLRADGSLRGRVMFPNSAPENDDAAFVLLDDPVAQFERIRSLVAEGFIVRTRSDANTVEARRNDFTRAQRAFESGAQFVSTDYETADPAVNPAFEIAVPGGDPVRCNPVSAPAFCRASDIE